jgi:hypothetical protein
MMIFSNDLTTAQAGKENIICHSFYPDHGQGAENIYMRETWQ